MRKLLFGLALASIAVVANAQKIDDFSDGDLDLRLDPPNSTLTGTRSGSMIGGTSRHTIAFTSNPDGNSARLRIVPRALVMAVSDEDLVATRTVSEYGYAGDLNLNLSGQSAFMVGTRNSDLPVSGMVKLESFVNGSYEAKEMAFIIPPTPTPTAYTVAFGGLVGSANFDISSVDKITFTFNTAPSGDFSLTELSAVPEPGTMAALGLGAAAMLRRRRSNRK